MGERNFNQPVSTETKDHPEIENLRQRTQQMLAQLQEIHESIAALQEERHRDREHEMGGNASSNRAELLPIIDADLETLNQLEQRWEDVITTGLAQQDALRGTIRELQEKFDQRFNKK